MSNTFAPNGFNQRGDNIGVTPNFAPSPKLISSANTHTICTGDPVLYGSDGYADIAVAGTTPVGGIFVGCEYLSVAQQRTVWSPKYLGADAAGDVAALVIDDPNATFLVQVGGSTLGPVAQADVGGNIQFAIGTPNTTTGISGAYVVYTSIATTSTLPFTILRLLNANDLAMNNDNTTANNWVVVGFNNQVFKQTTGV